MKTARGTTLDVGMVLDGKWVILEFIGKGGMGEVHRAHQVNLKRDVAIKIISQEWLQSFDCETEEIEDSLERFRREVQLMAQIFHPNVLQIFDQGAALIRRGDQELAIEYIAMEYVPGSTLRTTMSEEGFCPDEELMKEWLSTYFLPLLDGVQALHELGIVHRDLKPENVLLVGKTPKIADFGLASSCLAKPITRSFHVMGTPQYMPQEQFMNLRRTDQRADVYSLGKILFEAASGKIGPDLIPFKQAVLEDVEGAFFEKLNRVIGQATSEDKKHRLASVAELKQALVEALLGSESHVPVATETAVSSWFRSIPVPRWPLWIMATVLIIAAAPLLWLCYGPRPGRVSQPLPQVATQPQGVPEQAPPNLPTTLQGKDNVTLHLVPGGSMVLPQDFGSEAGQRIKVDAFYMDANPVTNDQYVSFLNQMLKKIHVTQGVVRSNGQIWLLLGEVKPGYEPIVFEGGRFRIRMAGHAACPVLRVTGYGAAAYARFYGKRLPTAAQWYYAVQKGWAGAGHSTATIRSQQNLPVPTPVMVYKPDAYGIRGLNANIGEWGRQAQNPSSDLQAKANQAYVILGGTHDQPASGTSILGPIERQPWEAFEKVGFRCVQDVPGNSKHE